MVAVLNQSCNVCIDEKSMRQSVLADLSAERFFLCKDDTTIIAIGTKRYSSFCCMLLYEKVMTRGRDEGRGESNSHLQQYTRTLRNGRLPCCLLLLLCGRLFGCIHETRLESLALVIVLCTGAGQAQEQAVRTPTRHICA